MIYGYCRVSTESQHLDRQIAGIKKYCPDIEEENIFIEKISGKKNYDERSEYKVLRRVLRNGDEIVIDSLDRVDRVHRQMKR